MWFATSEGLNRYDGNKLKVFLPEAENNKSIGSNHIKTLFVDSIGDLFVGGNNGVSRYLSDKGEFDNYNVL